MVHVKTQEACSAWNIHAAAAASAMLLLSASPVMAHEEASIGASRCAAGPQLVSEIADSSFMGFGGSTDGSNPFDLYGIAFKKYVIEVLDGEKIVSRKRGFTVDTCTIGVSVADEDRLGPQYQGLPIGEKMRVAGKDKTLCRRTQGPDLKKTCQSSCEASCSATVAQYAAETRQATGIAVDDKVLQRVEKSCIRDCRTECGKPGKVFDFSVSSRR